MTWIPTSEYPKRYGWNTRITAPGPSGREMFRNMRNIMRDPLPFLADVQHAHGDVVQFPIPAPVYLINSVAGVRDVLITHNRVMGKRTVQYTNLSLVTGEGLLTAEDHVWKTHRRLLQPAFHRTLLDTTAQHVQSALANLDQRWQEHMRDGVAVIDIDAEMMQLALEIVGKALFSVDLSGDAKKLTEATLQALHEVVARAQNPLALPLGVPTPSNRRMTSAIKTLDEAIAAIVAHRQSNPLPVGTTDMLDILLTTEEPLSPREIRDEIVTFIVAGHETVASGLTWSWQLLATHRDEFSALANEPARAERVFDEALRLYPPAWVISRRALTDLTIDGFDIPSGALLITSPWLHHRNPEVFANPEAFHPDRFADGVPNQGYIPFGAGPRICIGKDMARFEARDIIAHIATRYDIKATRSEVPVDASVTLRPRDQLLMSISHR